MARDISTIIKNIGSSPVSNNYGIWLSYNNQEEGFQIPVNPENIEISDGINSKTYDVAGLGEINVIKDQKLTEYSFSGFFPAVGKRITKDQGLNDTAEPFITAGIYFQEPGKYVDYILKWMGTKKPIRFVFTGDSFNINEAVSIEGFDWKETAGSGGDIEYTLKLKKYVFYSAQKVIVEKTDNGTKVTEESSQRPNTKETPKTYTVISGDSLWTIAKRTLGDGARWGEIQKLNGISDSELKTLKIGRKLKLL